MNKTIARRSARCILNGWIIIQSRDPPVAIPKKDTSATVGQDPAMVRSCHISADTTESRWRESNPRPAVYETAAIPLSHSGTPAGYQIRWALLRNKPDESPLGERYRMVTGGLRNIGGRGPPLPVQEYPRIVTDSTGGFDSPGGWIGPNFPS